MDRSVVESSFALRFDFVCDRFYLRGLFNSLVMGGMLLGSITCGLISDRFGRKTAMIVCLLLLWSCGIGNAFVPSEASALFGVLRVIVGASALGTFLCAFVIIAESTLPE